MHEQTKVAGVILAGGMARRMGGLDKGLILLNNRPMLAYAMDAMRPLVDVLMISANRNIEQYRQFGQPVVCDANAAFEGPLAGILAAMKAARGMEILLVMPCDSPLATSKHLQKLLATLQNSGAKCCTASDGKRLHPVFLALRTGLADSLEAFLASGQRKVGFWLEQQHCASVDFEDEQEIFANINTSAELQELEGQMAGAAGKKREADPLT